jgi:hypothetical protein
MKRGYQLAVVQFFCGCIFGAAIWRLSPTFTGHSEPWDANGSYFHVALFVAGVLAACVWPPGFCIGSLGVYCGQLSYMLLFLPGGPLILVGILMLVGDTLYALLGGAITYGVYRLILMRA